MSRITHLAMAPIVLGPPDDQWHTYETLIVIDDELWERDAATGNWARIGLPVTDAEKARRLQSKENA